MTLTWEIAGTLCAIITALLTALGWWIRQSIEREAERRAASATRIEDSQDMIKDDLRVLSEQFEKRVDRLETQARDFRPGTAIDQAADHMKRNLQTIIEGVKATGDKNSLAIESIRDRVTIVETKHAAVAGAVADLKNELRDTRSEINHRFDSMGEVQKTQFDQLCASIREVSKRDPK